MSDPGAHVIGLISDTHGMVRASVHGALAGEIGITQIFAGNDFHERVAHQFGRAQLALRRAAALRSFASAFHVTAR